MSSKFDITVLSGVSSGDVFHFNIDTAPVTVGRATECDLVLQDPMVSRKHLVIEKRRTQGFFLVDQGSTHGTFHMGFPLKAGSEGARQLRSGDEFKIGDMLFRVSFDESEFAPKTAEKKDVAVVKVSKLPPILRGPKGIGIALIAVAALGFLLWPEEKGGMPAQKSNEILTVPNYSLVGYYKSVESTTRKEEKDFTHLDKAQFDIPASDVLIEYDYIGESNVNVLLDDVSVEKLPPSVDMWQSRHVIIRGVAAGKQRRLVFDNLEWPKKEGEQPGAKPKRWAVRNMRAAPLTTLYGVESGFDAHLNSAMGLVEGIDKSTEGLFLLIRALETAAVELLKELKVDAIGYKVDIGDEPAKVTDISDLQQRLWVIKRGREAAFSVESSTSFLRELSRIISQLDAELWRRVNNRMNQARLAARVKNYIEAHDQLLSAKGMFPEEADYRWTLVNRMFNDKKIVPKRVREDPGAYRK